jgi:oxygen-independent coproporphyrinogen-3 oxidase
MPDRIAFYSYAHVPWIKGNGQRKFTEKDLPTPSLKQQLYETGKQLLTDLGYLEIGMDHFALLHDNLWSALQDKTLHRNFMGYSESKTRLMVGLGVSAISDSWTAFAQNEKSIEAYYSAINENRLPLFRGHILNKEDLHIRKHILDLMCLFKTKWNPIHLSLATQQEIEERLADFIKDGLIDIYNDNIKINETGKAFLRNICMAFDLKLLRKKPETQLFSMTI